MHFKGLDLNLLVALDALLEHKNVTRAGEHLHVSQSAMSGSLARLRKHFDDPLLVPLGRQLQRTSVADELMRQVRSILIQIEALVQTQPVFDPAASSRIFKVMASDYGLTVLVSELLRRVKHIAPSVGVEILPFSDSPSQSLEEGNIDTLIIAKEYLSTDHPCELLFQDTFVCVAWSGNPFVGEQISLDQFLTLDHVVVKYGKHSVSHIEEKFFQSGGFNRRIEVVVTNFSSVPHMIVGTHRIAIMHKRLAAIYAQTMPLKILSPPIGTPVVNESMQWHAYRENDPASAWLRAQVRATAAGLSNEPSTVPTNNGSA